MGGAGPVRWPLAFGALALAAALWPATAHAGPCDSHQPEAGVAIRAPMRAADLGAIPEACPNSSLTADARMDIALDVENYYGSVLASGTLRGRVALPRGPWISIYVPGVEYRLVANASLQPTSLDVGAGSIGGHFPLLATDELQLAPYARVLLPTETIYVNATRTGWELGTALTWNAHRMLELVGGVALPLTATFVGSETRVRFLPAAAVDLNFRPARWFTLAAGLGLRVEAEGEDAFEAFEPRAALRFYPWRGMLIELSGAFPFVGRDRTDVAAFLSLGWIFTHDQVGTALNVPPKPQIEWVNAEPQGPTPSFAQPP